VCELSGNVRVLRNCCQCVTCCVCVGGGGRGGLSLKCMHYEILYVCVGCVCVCV